MDEQPVPITAKITKVNKNGFMVDGYENWFNLSKAYEGQITIPPVGTEIEFKYKPWQVKGMDKPIFYVDDLVPATQVAAASYDGLQQAAAPAPVASTPVPTPAPVAEQPKNGPEPLPGDTTPVLGTHASTELSIQRQVRLKTAVEYLVGVYGAAAAEYKADDQLDRLIYNALYVARGLEPALLPVAELAKADVATPDDLVPTPSEMAAPPPEYTG